MRLRSRGSFGYKHIKNWIIKIISFIHFSTICVTTTTASLCRIGAAPLTSFTTYFSRFSTVFSFKEPCDSKSGYWGHSWTKQGLKDVELGHRSLYLEVNPVHSISDILEHALVGHEEVPVFESSLTATGTHYVYSVSMFLKEYYDDETLQQYQSLTDHHQRSSCPSLPESLSLQYLEYLEQLLKKSTRQAKR